MVVKSSRPIHLRRTGALGITRFFRHIKGLSIGMAAIVLLAVAFFFVRRGGDGAPDSGAAVLDREVASDTREIRYVESRDGRPLFVITARKNVATRGGVNDLEGVTAVYHGPQGKRQDRIEARQCRYSVSDQNVRFQGDVRLHSQGYTVITSRLDYNKTQEQVVNDADFRLEAPGLAGRGRGFRVSLRERTFRLTQPLELKYTLPDEMRDRPEWREEYLDLAAGSGWILDEGRTIRLEDGVTMSSALSRLTGAEMLVRLDAEHRVQEAATSGAAEFTRRDTAGEMKLAGDTVVFRLTPANDRLESVSADGQALLRLNGDELSAAHIRIDADSTGRVTATQATGGCRFAAARTGQEMTSQSLRLAIGPDMQPEILQLDGEAAISQQAERRVNRLSGGRIRIEFQAGAAAPAVGRITVLDRGRVTATSAGGDAYQATADELVVQYDAEGRFPARAEGRGHGDCQLQRPAPNETTTIQADRFRVDFFPGSADASAFEADGDVRLHRSAAGGRWSEATGRSLAGSLRPKERNRIDTMVLKGGVTYKDPEQQGWAAEANLKDDLLRLKGEPRFETGGAVTRAEIFVYDVRRRTLAGQGPVQTTIMPGQPGAKFDLSALGNGEGKREPVYLHASGLEGDEAAGRLVYRGPCRMVQGRNILTAGQFELEQRGGRFSARDKVRGIFFTRDGQGKEQRFEITSERMQYNPERREIRFEDQVRTRTDQGVMSADTLDGLLREGGGLSELVARGHVRLNQSARDATGDQLRLDLAAGLYVLSGAPAVVVDRVEGRTTRGTQLTFHRGDDKIRVDSGSQTIKK